MDPIALPAVEVLAPPTDTPIYDDLVTVTEAEVSETDFIPSEAKPEHGHDEHGHDPVTVCHNGHEITVDDSSVHLAHGDPIGACPVDPPVIVDPPVVIDPPVLPPVDPPILPPVDPPVDPPVLPPVDPPTVPDLPAPTDPPVVPDAPVVTPPDEVVNTPVGVGPDTSEHLPACTTEDGSAPGQEFPCLWDASTQGNGDGCSFVLDEVGGVAHYVTDFLDDGTVYTNDDACPVSAIIPVPGYQAEVSVNTTPFIPSELAETGSEGAGMLAGLAVTLVVLGVIVTRLRRWAVR